jgi:hypothetical protein
MKRFGEQKPIHFDEKELKTCLGRDNFIFVGSSNDMFADGVQRDWVERTLNHCRIQPNSYLFQSKNTYNFTKYFDVMPEKTVLCTTIETNRYYKDIMGNCKSPQDRACGFRSITKYKKLVTCEPLMDFDLEQIVELIKMCGAEQVNLGCDSGNNHLPEPSAEKILQLIEELQKFTVIHKKNNLKFILGKEKPQEPINFEKIKDLKIDNYDIKKL